MQNANEGKIIKHMADQEYPMQPWSNELYIDGLRQGYVKGYTTAQQSQPMWREIEGHKVYHSVMVRDGNYMQTTSSTGHNLIRLGYTHYLSSEDLLKLPTENK